jgi:peptidoglycan hydrolase CwlO-like protein
MALNQTVNEMRTLLSGIQSDLEKAIGGNKAASQRVRTGTVSLEKVAKRYRKESIVTEKKTKGRAKPASAAKKKPAAKAKPAHKAASHKAVKAKPKAKAAARPRALSVKRSTAKLPAKRRAHF